MVIMNTYKMGVRRDTNTLTEILTEKAVSVIYHTAEKNKNFPVKTIIFISNNVSE
jgi:hypothetical protein